MEQKERLAMLPGALLPWYEQNHRELPWRQDSDPYHIWVSEVMLQQTRVEAVKGYYTRFLETLPTISTLAECDDETLYKLWEGLGYYSRVRNLRKAAQQVLEEHGGEFPKEYAQILVLPGIGEYTAGAICSIAFNHPTPAVDGNVLRVIARLLDDHTPIDQPAFKKAVAKALAAIYPERAGDFTQALMELGATVCGPNRAPDCENCPCEAFCLGHQRKTAEKLPLRTPKRERKTETYTVFILSCCGKIALQKRSSKGLLAGMWQLPNVRGKLSTQQALEQVESFGLNPVEIRMEVEQKHIFTHIEWDMRGVFVEVKTCGGDFVWMDEREISQQAALPTAFRRFLPEPKQKISEFPENNV